jgi:hypothetical protein
LQIADRRRQTAFLSLGKLQFENLQSEDANFSCSAYRPMVALRPRGD